MISDHPLESLESFRVHVDAARVYRRPAERSSAKIDSDTLLSLLADLERGVEKGAARAQVVIEGLTFEDIDIRGMTLGTDIIFDACTVVGAFRLDYAILPAVTFSDSKTHRFSMRGASVRGDVDLHGTTILSEAEPDVGRIDLRDASVGGRVVLSNVQVGKLLNGRAAEGTNVFLDRARVQDVTLLDGCTPHRVSASSTQLSGGVILKGAQIHVEDAVSLLDAAPRPLAAEAEKPFNWDLLLQIIGLGTALSAWVAVVGGARLWARLTNAQVPALPTLVGIGREWMIVEGLQTLTFPVLLGAAVALCVYLSYRPRNAAEIALASSREMSTLKGGDGAAGQIKVWQRLRQASTLTLIRGKGILLAGLLFALVAVGAVIAWSVIVLQDVEAWVLWTIIGALVFAAATGLWAGVSAHQRIPSGMAVTRGIIVSGAISVVLAGVALGILWWQVLGMWWMAAMLVFTVLVVALTMGAAYEKTVRGVAFILFVAVVIWSGVLGIMQEAGAVNRARTWALATFEDGSHAAGEYLGNAGTKVYLASPMVREGQAGSLPVTPQEEGSAFVVDSRSVRELSLGQRSDVKHKRGVRPSALDQMCAALISAAVTNLCERREFTPNGDTGTDRTRPSEPPQEPKKVPPSPPLAVVQKTLGLQQVQLQVTSLKRRGAFIELSLSLNNLDDDSWTVGSILSRDGSPTASGIEAFDPPDKTAYLVASKAGNCACPVALDRTTLGPGEWRHLTVTLTAPRSATKTVDLEIPNFGWVPDVPIS